MDIWMFLALIVLTAYILGSLGVTNQSRQTIVIVPQETTNHRGCLDTLLVGIALATLFLLLKSCAWA